MYCPTHKFRGSTGCGWVVGMRVLCGICYGRPTAARNRKLHRFGQPKSEKSESANSVTQSRRPRELPIPGGHRRRPVLSQPHPLGAAAAACALRFDSSIDLA